MPFVDFKLKQELVEDAVGEYTVDARFYRGEYADVANPITHEIENKYQRAEMFKEVSIKFIPQETTRTELMQNLYDMLLAEKNNNDEVIPECQY